MKHITKLIAIAMVATLASCKTTTGVQKSDSGKTTTKTNAYEAVVDKITRNAQTAQYVTSKIKFRLKLDDKDVSLGGKLLMKRDDVIRIQLTALGLFEAGRVELTKDYVLVVDRINKQYIKVDYSNVDFLKQSGLNFYSLQALFWNELFLPGQTTRVTADNTDSYVIDLTNISGTTLSLDKGRLHYKWTASSTDGLLNSFNGKYADSGSNNVGVDWTYTSFKSLSSKMFPTENNIKITTPKKTIDVDLTLSSPNNDSDWETRTSVSSKYKQVALDDILRKLSSL